MSAMATVEDLTKAKTALEEVKVPKKVIEVLKYWGPKIGWKNLMHMLCYERTPTELKEGKRRQDRAEGR